MIGEKTKGKIYDTSTGYDFRYDDPLSPAKAIRAKCAECIGWEMSEIKCCTATPYKCRLYPYRMGKGCDRTREANPPNRTKAMRLECVEICMNGQAHFVRDCPSVGCALWPHRMGRGICQDPSGYVIKPRRKVELTESQRNAARERLKTARGVKKTNSDSTNGAAVG